MTSQPPEITNPGGLYGDATAETFPRTTGYRNPIIAEASRVLGYTNRFGHGIARTIKSLELNGNPPAQFAFDQVSFQVTVLARTDNERDSKKSLDSPS